ncbi:MAG: dienelactone hydrolase family protein [Planctomycetota bacterium]|nr:MAG: dienelactone hydrolase family protein [Planctomycetota bacterium]
MRSWTMMALTLWLGIAGSVQAAVQSKTITYRDGNVECRGFLAWNDAITGPRPGVLLVHEWWGLNDYAQERARQLAAEGYLAFACDMYGEGKQAKHPEEAGTMAAQVRENVDGWVQRGKAGLAVLTSQPDCDKERLAAIGYCFGGSTALQLAFHGADLDAVVSFHGALPVPTAEQAQGVASRHTTLLICHGSRDGFIPEETCQKVRTALDQAGADFEMAYYGNARHSFTVKSADSHGIEGLRYNAAADDRSWKRMLALFREKFSAK